MHLAALHNQVPHHAFTQAECWNTLQGAPDFSRIKPASQAFLKKILLGPAGIDKRHFCTAQLDKLFGMGPDELNHYFQASATDLGTRALQAALDKATTLSTDVDALLVCTCTGYLCPGLSSYIAEAAGLNNNIYMADLVGHGCGAAIPMLQAADFFLKAQPGKTVACIALEVCSAAFFMDDDQGVLVSLCLFGDGASASIWKGGEGRICPQNFRSVHLPQYRKHLKFDLEQGKLKNRLHRSVPDVVVESVREVLLGQTEMPQHIATHPGGKRILEKLEGELGLRQLNASREVLRQYGNMSSPSVLFALEQTLLETPGPASILTMSYGAGYTCYACDVEVRA